MILHGGFYFSMGLWHWVFYPKLFHLNGWWLLGPCYEASNVSKSFAVLRWAGCRHSGQCRLSCSSSRGKGYMSRVIRDPIFGDV